VQLFTGSFRENVHAFLERFAVRDAGECERGVHGYTVVLRARGEIGAACQLRVLVEVVERSKHIHCDQCKCIGASRGRTLSDKHAPEMPHGRQKH
jgi:hypothetical protein